MSNGKCSIPTKTSTSDKYHEYSFRLNIKTSQLVNSFKTIPRKLLIPSVTYATKHLTLWNSCSSVF